MFLEQMNVKSCEIRGIFMEILFGNYNLEVNRELVTCEA